MNLDPRNWTPESVEIQRPLNLAAPALPVMRRLMREPPKGRIPLHVRLDWPKDGTEWVQGMATTWTREFVLVAVGERRLAGQMAVWVAACDVRRP